MNDADDVDLEVGPIEAVHSGQDRANRRAELARRRAEDHREWDELLKWADKIIENLRAQNKVLRGRLKKRALILIAVGAVLGIALIWGASQTAGFWSLFLEGLGTGLLVGATVSVAAYVVAGYWKAATEISNEAILEELRDMHNRLTDVWVIMDSVDTGVLKDLDEFLMRQEAARLAAEEERQEFMEKVKKTLAEVKAERLEQSEADPDKVAANEG